MLGERVGEREGGETGDRRELGIHCGLGVLKYHASSFIRFEMFVLSFFSVVVRTAQSSVFALPGHPSLHSVDFYRRVHQVPYLCLFGAIEKDTLLISWLQKDKWHKLKDCPSFRKWKLPRY